MKVALLITFQQLSLRFLGCYGRPGHLTPACDRFATESVVFDSHFAENVDSAAVNHAWNCGRFQFPLSQDDQLKERDVLAAALDSGGVTLVEFASTPAETRTFAELVDAAADALRTTVAESDVDCLFWLKAEGVGTTGEFDDPEVDYAMRVAQLDAEFGRLWNATREAVETQQHELLVIVTAAEGADLGEQSHLPEPLRRLGEAKAHTPLMIYASDGEAGTRRRTLVETVDIVPTLCDWFSLPADSTQFDGLSLLPLVRGDREEFAPSERSYAYIGDGRRATGIRDAREYLVAASELDDLVGDERSVHLFTKPDDIWELHDVSSQNPHAVEELSAKLAEFLAARCSTTSSAVE